VARPSREPKFSEYIELDLSDVVASIAGPKRPQDRIALTDAKTAFRKDIHNYVEENLPVEHSKLERPSRRAFPASDPAVLSFADNDAVVPSAPSVRTAGPAIRWTSSARAAASSSSTTVPW